MSSSGTTTRAGAALAGDARPVLAVDDRQDPKFTEALGDYFTVKVKHLATGDLVWSCPLGSVGVEDKRFSDYLQSLRNKRLDDELRRLGECYSIPVLYVRGPIEQAYHIPGGHGFDEEMLSKGLLGRQLHGIYTYRTQAKTYDGQAMALWGLWDYTQKLDRGFEGVRREKKLYWAGPLGTRAEALYGILGRVGGVRNRRTAALALANHPLSELVTWGPTEWNAAGYSKLMAQKLTNTFMELG